MFHSSIDVIQPLNFDNSASDTLLTNNIAFLGRKTRRFKLSHQWPETL